MLEKKQEQMEEVKKTSSKRDGVKTGRQGCKARVSQRNGKKKGRETGIHKGVLGIAKDKKGMNSG